jgi:T5SS/PEP-CTERM-associated repeat protein
MVGNRQLTEINMATYSWTGAAGTEDFSTPNNWLVTSPPPPPPPVTAPGPGDDAMFDTASTTIAGTGTAGRLIFGGSDVVRGQMTAVMGIQAGADLSLHPGAVLTTPFVGVGVASGNVGKLTIGKHSSLVVNGFHLPNNYAIGVANATGSTGTLRVHGAGATLNGGNEPISIGQNGNGVMRIEDGGMVSAGNADPLIYPWAVIIGNHAGANGTVEVSNGSLLAQGEIIVGRSTSGMLKIGPSGLVSAPNLAAGWTSAGQGAVTVHGEHARLVLVNTLEVGHMGFGSLDVADHGTVSAGVSISVNGPMTLADGLIETTSMAINANGTLVGHGTVITAAGCNNTGNISASQQLTLIGPMQNNGMIKAVAGSALRFVGAISGSGTITLTAGSAASLEAVESGQTIAFSGSNAKLVLRSPSAFGGSISGFDGNDTIVLDAAATDLSFVPGVLTVFDAAIPGVSVAKLTMIGVYSITNFKLTPGNPAVISYV